MHGTNFRTSQIGRLRRRTDGPTLTLIWGRRGDTRIDKGDDRPTHPAQKGFTPDGLPGDARGSAVHGSEPVSPAMVSTSSGLSRFATAGLPSPGSGPNDLRGRRLDSIAEFLDRHAGDDSVAGEVNNIRLIR
jgi:hypothetical protein